jgi:hypothetical protein
MSNCFSQQIIEHNKTMTYNDGNRDPGFVTYILYRYILKCGGVKLVNMIRTNSHLLDNWTFNHSTDINKQ